MAVNKKTGSIEGFFKNVKAIGAYVKSEMEYGVPVGSAKEKRPELYAFYEYGKEINLYLNSKGGRKPFLQYRDIDILYGMNKMIKADTIFTEATSDFDRKWQHSEISRKAMQKFTDMAMQSDRQKLSYAHKVAGELGVRDAMPMKEVFTNPLPIKREATPLDEKKLKYNISELAKRLKAADKKMHVDSSEFKKMKAALNKLNETLNSGNHTNEDIGKQLETLQDATMGYLQAKGVGKQSTTLGQNRMDIALDICGLSADFMDVYASKERIAEVQKLENEYEVSFTKENGVCDYADTRNLDKYKDGPELEKAPEAGGPML